MQHSNVVPCLMYPQTIAGYNAGETPLPPTPTNFPTTTNVRTYGALGNGVANDTAAFVAAVAAQPTGGVVYIPPGKYLFGAGSRLRITRRVSLVGAGPRQTTIIQDTPLMDRRLIEYAGSVLSSGSRSRTRLASISTIAFRGTNVLRVQVGSVECVSQYSACVQYTYLVAVLHVDTFLMLTHQRRPSTALCSRWDAGSL
jgi:hypothetical protein